MGTQEMLLHTFAENGVERLSVLDSYIRTDIKKHSAKLTDLSKRLDNVYKDLMMVVFTLHETDDSHA